MYRFHKVEPATVIFYLFGNRLHENSKNLNSQILANYKLSFDTNLLITKTRFGGKIVNSQTSKMYSLILANNSQKFDVGLELINQYRRTNITGVINSDIFHFDNQIIRS